MANLKIGRIVMGMCQTNCYFVYPEGKSEVILFDPADRGDYIYHSLKDKGFTVAAILLTHGHFDHIWGLEELKELSGAKVYAYEEEKEVCENASVNVSKGAGRPCEITADEYVKDGATIIVEADEHTDFSYVGRLGYTLQKEKLYKTNKHVFLTLNAEKTEA